MQHCYQCNVWELDPVFSNTRDSPCISLLQVSLDLHLTLTGLLGLASHPCISLDWKISLSSTAIVSLPVSLSIIVSLPVSLSKNAPIPILSVWHLLRVFCDVQTVTFRDVQTVTFCDVQTVTNSNCKNVVTWFPWLQCHNYDMMSSHMHHCTMHYACLLDTSKCGKP